MVIDLDPSISVSIKAYADLLLPLPKRLIDQMVPYFQLNDESKQACNQVNEVIGTLQTKREQDLEYHIQCMWPQVIQTPKLLDPKAHPTWISLEQILAEIPVITEVKELVDLIPALYAVPMLGSVYLKKSFWQWQSPEVVTYVRGFFRVLQRPKHFLPMG